MARLFLGNDKDVFLEFKKHNLEIGFHNYSSFEKDNISVIAFKKLKIDNENYCEFGNDFISGVGTFIYKESIGAIALKQIYNDFSGDLLEIRKNLIGNYLFALKKSEKVYVFCDANNIFNAYYYENKGQWCISNCLYEIALALPIELGVNEFNVIEQIFQYNILGNGTVFNEIQKLLGNEYLEIDIEKGSFCKKQLYLSSPYKISERPLEELVDEFCSDLQEITRKVVKCFDGDIGVCMTGGLDARMILAAFLSNDCKPVLTYGVGNSQLTNTKNGDLEVDKIYSKRFNLPLKIMDWSTPDPVDLYWDKYIDKYGFYASVYSSSNHVMSAFENLEERFLNVGYYGELYRNIDWIDSFKSHTFSLNAFLDNYYMEKNLNTTIDDCNKYRLHLKNKIHDILKLYDISSEEELVDKDYFTILSFEKRKGSDSSMINYINQHRYSFAILAEPNLIEKAFIPIDSKKDAIFIIKVLERLFPPILEIPFFSRCEWRVFDPKSKLIVKDPKGLSKYHKLIRKYFFLTHAGQRIYYRLCAVVNLLRGNKKTAKEAFQRKKIASRLSCIIRDYGIFNHHVDPMVSVYLSQESRYAILLKTFFHLRRRERV
ncbi:MULTISPECIES: hypothetical protein [Butyricimonas]|uniref:hypothetical protein n=1 Tax=Butyricimonas TaxID=574697 RepID=UPI00207E3B75|nr:hypothetical protein [Butyricimonas paravirosa]BDF55662.1 hypothetical protein CE91St21_30970 [Odoribacteraceae bacterium]GKH94527.1 hypothetical protein CE91St23_30230 [Odoribacteraceae bacterium]GKI00559.1 hypothetical protein CE91St22_44360 [Odoribacteraceae bacterium]GKI02055.1 hypothetical protein CE91St24_13300 [Odoribacteraceae bacterium]